MLSSIIGKEITDIYAVGFMYLEDEENEFTQDLRWIYFEFEDILVEFESFEQFSRLRMKEVEEIRYLFEYDEDMIKVKSSIKELILVSSILNNNIVKSIELKDYVEESCAAAKIILENGRIIFLDPSFPYGIGVGGKEQEEYWQDVNN